MTTSSSQKPRYSLQTSSQGSTSPETSSRSANWIRYLSGGRSASWRVDESDDLSVDFDGSLTGLGVDLPRMSFGMSDCLMSVPVLNEHRDTPGFQYVLTAPTSPATKMNEDTLTYLNQGQLYEVKLKKLSHATGLPRGKYFKSICKVCFHERRLQYTEQENVEKWKQMRRGERVIDIDIPHSYGIMDLRMDPYNVNVAEFVWDSAKDTGLYLKINCISTEFTIKKHGGEKGVAFRIQIDTYFMPENEAAKLVHCASCQVKVFKPKGADRKHKTDKDKIDKLPESEKERYQPSYECTVFSELSLDLAICNQTKKVGLQGQCSSSNSAPYIDPRSPVPLGCYTEPSSPASTMTSRSTTPLVALTPLPIASGLYPIVEQSSSGSSGAPVKCVSSISTERSPIASQGPAVQFLSCNSSAAEVAQWLQANRFAHCFKTFQNFTGSDMLCLSREELIQICGVADGIRLNNALLQRQVRSRLSLYVSMAAQGSDVPVFHAIYLARASSLELIEKIARLFGVSASFIHEILVVGTNSMRLMVSDDVVENMAEGLQYSIEVLKSGKGEQYHILLRPMTA